MISFLSICLISSCAFAYSFVIATHKDDGISLPIIMYHSILKDTNRSNKYTITPSTLESDLEYIYNIVISRLLRVESDFDKGYILALLQSNKINQ